MMKDKKVDEGYIKKLFPEIDEIQDANLKDLVIKVWILAMERGVGKASIQYLSPCSYPPKSPLLNILDG